jgi:nitrite reductase/ring-hydroxylating ferredoxin subunit
VRVRLLGEELVAFRDSEGRIGLIDEHCTHRGTSLFFGRNEDCGLRCVYHGWKYDVEGNVVDTPAEPPGSDFRKKIRQTAYPTYEAAGVIHAYLGPRDKMPLFPNYEWTQVPLNQTYVTKSLLECNYLQGLEGECDYFHSGSGAGDLAFGPLARLRDRGNRFRRAIGGDPQGGTRTAIREGLEFRYAGFRLCARGASAGRARRFRNSHLCPLQ